MPESKRRNKGSSAAPEPAVRKEPTTSPRWWAPVMVALMVVGLVWIVTFYITQQEFPVPGIGLYNLAIGFGIAMVGFLMTTRWR